MRFQKGSFARKKGFISLPAGRQVFRFLPRFGALVLAFSKYLFGYLQRKIVTASLYFEKQKNLLVKFFTMKRGRYSRPFLHVASLGILALIIGIAPFLADSYPVLSGKSEQNTLSLAQAEGKSITMDDTVFSTDSSQKTRDKVIEYTVQKGDTLSTIAKKFGVSTDTIRWANDLSNDTITVGDSLKIPPVTGSVHKVASGDTIYTIAKKYNTDAQGIADFPFNHFANPETFSLIVGQQLIVPAGIKPSEQNIIKRETFIASGPVPVSPGGFTFP